MAKLLCRSGGCGNRRVGGYLRSDVSRSEDEKVGQGPGDEANTYGKKEQVIQAPECENIGSLAALT